MRCRYWLFSYSHTYSNGMPLILRENLIIFIKELALGLATQRGGTRVLRPCPRGGNLPHPRPHYLQVGQEWGRSSDSPRESETVRERDCKFKCMTKLQPISRARQSKSKSKSETYIYKRVVRDKLGQSKDWSQGCQIGDFQPNWRWDPTGFFLPTLVSSHIQ